MAYAPPAALKPFLRLLVPLYRASLERRRQRALAHPVGFRIPIISVGNLTVGGTGKTLLIPFLARTIEADFGLKVGVASRGYRGFAKEASLVSTPDPYLYGDEPALLTEEYHLPVAVARKREEAVQLLMDRVGVQVVLLDDGFQYWSLRRSLDLVLWDATQRAPEGLLPAGPLREPLPALVRADAMGLTRVNLSNPQALETWRGWLARVAPSKPVFEFSLNLTEKPWIGCHFVVAVSGIANPAPFERLIHAEGPKVTPLRFPDHHRYTEAGVERINALVRETRADAVLTTLKDYIKLKSFTFDKPLHPVRVELALSGDPAPFHAFLSSALRSQSSR